MQGVTVALAGGVSRIPLSKFEHMSGPETNLTLITGRVWQMGFPSIVTWHLCLSSTHINIFGSAREIYHSEIYHIKSTGLREISHSEIYHREFDLARNPLPVSFKS